MARGTRLGRIAIVAAAAVSVGGLGWMALGGPTGRSDRAIFVADGCPAILRGTSNANEDFADMFYWQARVYIRTDTGVVPIRALPRHPQPGPEVTRVTCSLSDPPMDAGQRIAPGPWPDGTATALRNGTPIYAVRGVPTDCLLMAARDGELGPYVAVDFTEGTAVC